MRTVEELNRDTNPERVSLRGALRRMVVSLTAKALWQLVGVRLPDGSSETFNAEPFTGIGHFARPPAGNTPEAIVIMVNGSKGPTIIAVRDEKTRAAIAGALQPDETMGFNSKSCWHIKADGTIEIRSAAGIAEAMLKGQTYRAAEDTMLTALGVFATAIGALNPVTAAGAAVTLNAAITAFQSAAATYLAQVGRVE